MKRLLFVAAVAFAVCVSPALAILKGDPDGNAHPYVGFVRFAGPGPSPTCSGTAISAHRFLTAAHCFPPGLPVRITFVENARAATPADWFFGTFFPHPGWCAGCGPGVPNLDSNDVAIVVTSASLPGPYALLPELGQADRLAPKTALVTVGYGIRERVKDVVDEFGQRYRATQLLSPAEGVLASQFVQLSASKGGACFGDSGGPSLLGTTVLAINSFTINQNCAGNTYSNRLDIPATRDFVESFAP
jgi:hypothetical protein